jgi:hypothetical protein
MFLILLTKIIYAHPALPTCFQHCFLVQPSFPAGFNRVTHVFSPRVRGEENVPTEDTQHQVEHEEGSDHNERDEVDPVEEAAQSVVGLTNRKKNDYSVCTL